MTDDNEAKANGEPDNAAVARLLAALGDLPIQEKLGILECAWMAVASHGRIEGLPELGGFTAEQDRQVKRLEEITMLVRGETPDLEMERLRLEGNLEGIADHLQRRLKEGTS